ncbi:MAG: insulinase family protein [Bacteroidetes bacterium]|nr:MAG: insulinase family protein [Bacteroidota bacterium]
MLNRAIAPPITNAVDFDFNLKPYDLHTLDNGVQVLAVDGGAEDVVLVEWVFEAGNSWEKKSMVAGATNHLLKNGTATKTAFDINEQFEFFGAFLNRGAYNETSNITLHALSKHLPALLPMVAELITDAVFPQQELDIFKQNSKQRLSVNLRKCDFVAHQQIDALLYGSEHPYGKYSKMEHLDDLLQADLTAFYTQHYTQGSCIIFIAGKLPTNAVALLNQSFGQLPLTPLVVVPTAPKLGLQTAPNNRQVRITNDANGVQGAIRMARNFPNRHHPDFLKVQVLNTLFGGFFGSRLMSNIREDKGYTYGIHSYLQNHVEQSAWMISTEAGREVCEATIGEVYAEMERLRQTPIPQSELDLVRNYMLGSLLGDLDGPFQIMARWKNYVLHGINTEAFFHHAVGIIKTVSAEELQQLAQQYLQPEAFYELVVV